MLSIRGTDFIACWACAEMFKSRISRPNRIRFSKISCYRPLGPYGFGFCKKSQKKKFHACVPLNFNPFSAPFGKIRTNFWQWIFGAHFFIRLLDKLCGRIFGQLLTLVEGWISVGWSWIDSNRFLESAANTSYTISGPAPVSYIHSFPYFRFRFSPLDHFLFSYVPTNICWKLYYPSKFCSLSQ